MVQRLRQPAVKPMDSMRARHHLNLSTVFVKQCCGFKRALSTANHQHLLAGKASKVTVLGGVGCQGRGNRLKLRWPASETTDTRRKNDAPRVNLLSVLSNQAETIGVHFQPNDLTPIQISHHLALIPL